MKKKTGAVAQTLTIGGLAKAAGVHVETIRYYQRRGLLSEPKRPPGGIRRYGAADIDRLRFVKGAQQLGFCLDEISDLLRLEDGTQCQEAGALAERKLGDVREKIQRLERIEKVLSEMLDRCHAQQGRASEGRSLAGASPHDASSGGTSLEGPSGEDSVTCPLIASLHEGVGEDGASEH